MQSELRPCAHCGGEASIGHVAFSRPLTHIEWEDGTPVTEAFYGHCKNCSASTRNGFHGGQRNEAEAITAWNTRASDAEITRLTEALRAAEEREKGLREALGATESAIAEYYRYWTGGETRGSYDGKPERNALWQTREKARQTLAALKGPSHDA